MTLNFDGAPDQGESGCIAKAIARNAGSVGELLEPRLACLLPLTSDPVERCVQVSPILVTLNRSWVAKCKRRNGNAHRDLVAHQEVRLAMISTAKKKRGMGHSQ